MSTQPKSPLLSLRINESIAIAEAEMEDIESEGAGSFTSALLAAAEQRNSDPLRAAQRAIAQRNAAQRGSDPLASVQRVSARPTSEPRITETRITEAYMPEADEAEAGDESIDEPHVPRTLGRSTAHRLEESSPAARRKEEKMAAARRKVEEKAAAELRKVEEKAAALLKKEEEREAAIREKEEAREAAIRKKEEERAAIEQRREEARLEMERKREERRRRPGFFARAFSWLGGNRALAENKMRITESLSLGEKRFVAVLHVDGRKFLIGGGSSGVSLLAALDTPQPAAQTGDLHQPSLGELSQKIAIVGDRW